ncbi:MAG: hypothetical protein QNJ63_18085 [Calothrix sp. MO_192.B10]|nr:hypothetical protein [Calothrix sp. MO_192.B10]
MRDAISRDVALQRLYYVQAFSQRHTTARMQSENLHRILPSLQKKDASCINPKTNEV